MPAEVELDAPVLESDKLFNFSGLTDVLIEILNRLKALESGQQELKTELKLCCSSTFCFDFFETKTSYKYYKHKK